MSLYKLVTTENVDLNYKAFKKDELIDCILNLRTTYFRLKKENEENEQLKDNWNKLKEYIDVKLYNVEYIQKLCGCKIDDVMHMILEMIKKEMQELEGSDSNVKK